MKLLVTGGTSGLGRARDHAADAGGRRIVAAGFQDWLRARPAMP